MVNPGQGVDLVSGRIGCVRAPGAKRCEPGRTELVGNRGAGGGREFAQRGSRNAASGERPGRANAEAELRRHLKDMSTGTVQLSHEMIELPIGKRSA